MQVDGELPVDYKFELVEDLGNVIWNGRMLRSGGVRCLDSWNVVTEETETGPATFDCFGFRELDAFE
jgi:hypothetical protein